MRAWAVALLLCGCASTHQTVTRPAAPLTSEQAPVSPPKFGALFGESYQGAVVRLHANRFIAFAVDEYGEEPSKIMIVRDGQVIETAQGVAWFDDIFPPCPSGAQLSVDREKTYIIIEGSCTEGEDVLHTDEMGVIIDVESPPGAIADITPKWAGMVGFTRSNQVSGCMDGESGSVVVKSDGVWLLRRPWVEAGEPLEEGLGECDDEAAPASETKLF